MARSLVLMAAAATQPVPGVVVDHVPAGTGVFVGSPAIAVLPDGAYVAAHDEFGPKSACRTHAVTRVFRSVDRGRTWVVAARLTDAFWGTLFVHRGDLYWVGTGHEYGDLLARRSTDGGRTWTTPADAATGVLARGRFHTAPVPVVEHAGRLYRGVEDADGGGGWGRCFRARLMSAPADADLLRSASWTITPPAPSDPAWLGGHFGGWLEGNAVVTPAGGVADLLRVDDQPDEGVAALARLDGGRLAFDPAHEVARLPVGGKKFTVRFDPPSGLYWSLGNVVLPADRQPASNGDVRNTVALVSSPDLVRWTTRGDPVLHADDWHRDGFQYLDWQFDGPDLVAVSRTAAPDDAGGAARAHDANYLTFHRFADFRGR